MTINQARELYNFIIENKPKMTEEQLIFELAYRYDVVRKEPANE